MDEWKYAFTKDGEIPFKFPTMDDSGANILRMCIPVPFRLIAEVSSQVYVQTLSVRRAATADKTDKVIVVELLYGAHFQFHQKNLGSVMVHSCEGPWVSHKERKTVIPCRSDRDHIVFRSNC